MIVQRHLLITEEVLYGAARRGQTRGAFQGYQYSRHSQNCYVINITALVTKTSEIAEWLTTKFSSAPSATVEDKYRGTIPPKVYFQTFLLRVIPT
jgi:hypothetical protein